MNNQTLQETLTALMPIIIILIIWEAIWKLIALWKSGRNNHLAWFICIALINTAGILPIIYILMHRKKPLDTNKKAF
jgi:sorbitol-specific phosphotransferase system component IIC